MHQEGLEKYSIVQFCHVRKGRFVRLKDFRKILERVMSIFSGKCLCGKITYECHAEPKAIFNCHCEDCRRATGSVFGTNLFVSEDQVEIFGEVCSFTHTSDSGSTMTRMPL